MKMTSTSASEVDEGAKIRRLHQHIAALVTSLGGFALGVTLGWNTSAGEVLRGIGASRTEINWIGGALNVGACVGVLLVPFFVKYHLGRLTTIMFLIMPGFIVGWTFVCAANEKVLLLVIGRFVCGMSGGAFCVLTPIYIAEIADKHSRERLLTYFHLLINCGIVYAFVIAHMLNEHTTIWRCSLACAITCPMITLVNLFPESPLCYLMKNNEIKARKSLKRYRGETYEDDVEMQELKRLAATSQSAKMTIRTMKNHRVARSFLACLFAFLAQQLSGVNIMIFYALTLFNVAGSDNLTGSEQTIVVGVLQILSCFLATCLVQVLGRRLLLAVSSAFMGLFLMLLGWFYKLRNDEPEYDDIFFWMPPTWIVLFFVAFNVGVGPISWSLLGDAFPIEIKTTAAACVVAISWLLSLTVTMFFTEILITLGVPKTLWLFAGSCWLTGALCALLVKETRGRSLSEIQDSFEIERGRVENAEPSTPQAQ